MDSFSIFIMFFGCIGFGLMLYSLFIPNKEKQHVNTEIEHKIKAIDTSVADADSAISELDSLAKSMVTQIDDKYQELLFLYNLIDEKEKGLANSDHLNADNISDSSTQINTTRKTIYAIDNPKLTEITRLLSSGMTIAEVSKQLGIGQGEAKLIIELGKGKSK